MKERRRLALRRREAQIHDLTALLHRPPQAGEERRRAALRSGSQHPHAPELAGRRERPNDSATGRSMPGDVSLAVLNHHGLAVRGLLYGHRLLHVAHELMPGIDPTVHYGHAHASALGSTPRPIPADLVW